MKKKYQKIYFIAEVGVNHNANLQLALKSIDLAKIGGANAVKFQAYKAEKIASKYANAYWDQKKENEKSQINLFKKYDKFEFLDYKKLSQYCNKKKIDFILTPFDVDSIKYFKSIVSSFKISSSDITNFPLIHEVAKTKIKLILSTGASNIKEIDSAIKIIEKYHNKITILHCVLNYPTHPYNANIGMVEGLKKYGYNVGISDHTVPSDSIKILSYAYARGTNIFEKHFTHNKKLKGNDHYHSFDFRDLQKFLNEINYIDKIYGTSQKKVLKSEIKSRQQARRSIYYKTNLNKGHFLSLKDIIMLRPDVGISSAKYSNFIGKKLLKVVNSGQLLKKTDFKIS